MPHGVPTELAVVEQFRAAYLYSGNASKCARDLGIAEQTGRELAKKLSAEPGFGEERRALRAQALEELVAMRQRIAEEASGRFHSETGGIDVKRFGGSGDDDPQITITDRRHEYGKLVFEAEKNAQALARLDAERGGEIAPEREVVVRFEGFPKKPSE
jgi:hypothetical protein